MSEQVVNEYVQLHQEKKELESRLKRVKQDIEVREPVVEEYFAEHGFQNIRTENGTAYLHREILVNLRPEESGSHDGAHETMRKHGLGYMIKESVNTSTLRSHFAEAIKSGDEIPQDLADYLNVMDRHRVRVRS
jgi:hypothetical protein